MKTRITVSWANTVEIEVDESRLNDGKYLEDIRNRATYLAGENINWKDGVVTDCEDIPKLVE
jgi:hypothetical protein